MKWLQDKCRERIRGVQDDYAKLQQKYYELERETRELQFAENSARAQLMQLRVHGMSVRGRTGFGVTAFIPMEVLDKLGRADDIHKTDFAHVIASELVLSALNGMWNINSRGAVTTTIFADVGNDGMPVVGHLFDSQLERARGMEIRENALGGRRLLLTDEGV